MMRTFTRVLWTGMLAVVLTGLAAAPARAQVTLRYKFKEGETLKYTVEQRMNMNGNVAGNDITMEMGMNMDMTWKVLSVNKDGSAKLTQTIDRVRMTMKAGPLGEVDIDTKSDKEPSDPIGKAMAPIFKAMAGAEFTMTMTPLGEPKDVQVPEKVLNAVKNAGGGLPGASLSPDDLKQMVNQGGLVLPEKPVKKGDSWTHSSNMAMQGMKMKVDTKATYEGETTEGGKKLQEISLAPKMTTEGGPAGVEIKLKNQESKGKALFDNDKGRVVETELNQNMDMDLSAGGQSFTMKIRQTVTMKLAK